MKIKRTFIKAAEVVQLSRKAGGDPPLELTDEPTNYVLFDQQRLGQFLQELYIKHPFKPTAITIQYSENNFLNIARRICESESLDENHPCGLVFVKHNQIVSTGANGSNYHQKYGCDRKKLGIPTGHKYELCQGCHPKNHSEAKAIRRAQATNKYSQLQGATAYLYGEWWCCQPCCQKMEAAGIKKVVFSKSWTAEFLEIN